LLAFVLLTLLSTAWLFTSSKLVYAQLPSSTNVNIDHEVILLDGGQVRLNENVRLSADQPVSISSFNLGFPSKYKFNIDHVVAYESSDPENMLTVDLDVGLGTGFYAVKINFGKDVTLDTENSYSFTIVFLFSNLIIEEIQDETTLFHLDFPAFPSLAQNISWCKSTVILPSNADFVSSYHPFNETTTGVLTLVNEPLESFYAESGNVTFQAIDTFSLYEIKEMKREITITEFDQLIVSDSYQVTNMAFERLTTFRVTLPGNASEVSARDDLDNTLTVSLETKDTTTEASITLTSSPIQNETITITVTSMVPWKNHISQTGLANFNLAFKSFDPANSTLKKLTVIISLPEGAKFQSVDLEPKFKIEHTSIYRETATLTLNNVTSFQNPDFSIAYNHMLFWTAFRPTMWTGAIVLFIGVIAALWQLQAQRAPPTPVTTVLPIRLEELKNYVKSYDEKRKIMQQRESLEKQAQKGKIPRRLYRVRSRTLESRLNVISRDLNILKEKIRVAGLQYAEMMRQIEVAENDLKGAEADINRAKVGYRRGELSAAAYRQSLQKAYRRRDRAQTNIDGVLIRLREQAG
jgi:hypothetical protein